jgi:CRISPR-associated protein Cas1
MSNFLNTLFVTTQGAYLAKDHENVAVRVEKETRLSVPMHHLTGLVCFGRVTASPELMAACMEKGIGLSFLTENGKFLARVEGERSGNVLLRRRQYRLADDPAASAGLARGFVTGKIANARTLLLRSAREQGESEKTARIRQACIRLDHSLDGATRGESVDSIRGYEGEAAAQYFSVFGDLVRDGNVGWSFTRRIRRPPTDPVNALLSFLYVLLLHDASSALQAVGLDPAVGYLHDDRPGRPSLALDLMEEFRPALADRLLLALVNLGQVGAEDFTREPTGACWLTDKSRKQVLVAYQKRKQEVITHPLTGEETPIGLLMHVQARLLARAIRGDLEAYPPFFAK